MKHTFTNPSSNLHLFPPVPRQLGCLPNFLKMEKRGNQNKNFIAQFAVCVCVCAYVCIKIVSLAKLYPRITTCLSLHGKYDLTVSRVYPFTNSGVCVCDYYHFHFHFAKFMVRFSRPIFNSYIVSVLYMSVVTCTLFAYFTTFSVCVCVLVCVCETESNSRIIVLQNLISYAKYMHWACFRYTLRTY